MDITNLEDDLISEIKLEPLQAKTYILITCRGKMSPSIIAKELGITYKSASDTANELMEFGALIDMPNDEFEAMHPRFTAVNMYRKYCERNGVEFKRNKIVDNIGAALEKPYEDARTK